MATATVVDPSARNLAQARQATVDTSIDGHVEFYEGFVSDLPVDEKFDVITLLLVLHTIKDEAAERRLLEGIRARMAPNGTLILTDMCFEEPTPMDALLDQYHARAAKLGAPEDMVSLETRSVVAARDRTVSRLEKLVSDAGLRLVRPVATAHWYRCFLVGAA